MHLPASACANSMATESLASLHRWVVFYIPRWGWPAKETKLQKGVGQRTAVLGLRYVWFFEKLFWWVRRAFIELNMIFPSTGLFFRVDFRCFIDFNRICM